jgi:hypothetical protein
MMRVLFSMAMNGIEVPYLLETLKIFISRFNTCDCSDSNHIDSLRGKDMPLEYSLFIN